MGGGMMIKLQIQPTRKLEQFVEPLPLTMHFEVWLCQQRADCVQVLEAVGIPETIREKMIKNYQFHVIYCPVNGRYRQSSFTQ